jgi:uncharacterized protein YndB with AHSA1/START domain
MITTHKEISSKSVQKATGKTLEEWYKIIDREGGKKMTHREIARMLYDKKYIKSGWWCQMVTVQYEYTTNRRVIGKTADVGFEIGVTKTFPVSPKEAWELLTSEKGAEIWLGRVKGIGFRVKEKFQTEEGIEGEIRTLDRGRKLRLKLGTTTVQLYVLPTGEKTSIHFHQEKLKSMKEREAQRKHWQNILTGLEKKLVR